MASSFAQAVVCLLFLVPAVAVDQQELDVPTIGGIAAGGAAGLLLLAAAAYYMWQHKTAAAACHNTPTPQSTSFKKLTSIKKAPCLRFAKDSMSGTKSNQVKPVQDNESDEDGGFIGTDIEHGESDPGQTRVVAFWMTDDDKRRLRAANVQDSIIYTRNRPAIATGSEDQDGNDAADDFWMQPVESLVLQDVGNDDNPSDDGTLVQLAEGQTARLAVQVPANANLDRPNEEEPATPSRRVQFARAAAPTKAAAANADSEAASVTNAGLVAASGRMSFARRGDDTARLERSAAQAASKQ